MVDLMNGLADGCGRVVFQYRPARVHGPDHGVNIEGQMTEVIHPPAACTFGDIVPHFRAKIKLVYHDPAGNIKMLQQGQDTFQVMGAGNRGLGHDNCIVRTGDGRHNRASDPRGTVAVGYHTSAVC